MALRALVLQNRINTLHASLQELLAKDADFTAREESLTADIMAAQTEEERQAVDAAVGAYDTELAAHESAKAAITADIQAAETELAAIEAKQTPPAPAAAAPAAEHNNERIDTVMIPQTSVQIRHLPLTQRAFDALPMAQRNEIVAQEDVQTFFAKLRSMKGTNAALQGGELTIPVIFLDLIAENMYRYSKLLNRVRIRDVGGEARQTIAGTVPEAVWTEMCGVINELTFAFNQVTLDGYKLAGFIPVCNSLLEDSDLNLASWIVEMLSEALGLAMDKAILYGKGSASHMPLGIVTRLAQTSKPEGYPDTAPEWVDLHTSNIKSIAADATGTAFWAALQRAVVPAYNRYARGEMFWAMNSKTYGELKARAIATNLSGEFVAMIGGSLPIVSGDIDILEFMPDNDIVGGFGDLYLTVIRRGMSIEQSREVQFIQDNTVFKAKMRADGVPVIAGAFVAINIAGSTPATSMLFAADTANTVAGVILPATASVAAGASIKLPATLLPFGVKGEITWTSGTTAKATVDADGTVTGVASGTSVITAAAAGQSATCTVTVTSA
jgi:HK97 family phage major capsid protein